MYELAIMTATIMLTGIIGCTEKSSREFGIFLCGYATLLALALVIYAAGRASVTINKPQEVQVMTDEN